MSVLLFSHQVVVTQKLLAVILPFRAWEKGGDTVLIVYLCLIPLI